MRIFVRLREMIASHEELAEKFEDLEKKYDTQFQSVFEAIRQLMTPSVSERKQIGFRVKEGKVPYIVVARKDLRKRKTVAI